MLFVSSLFPNNYLPSLKDGIINLSAPEPLEGGGWVVVINVIDDYEWSLITILHNILSDFFIL